jgi:hypothetical protein
METLTQEISIRWRIAIIHLVVKPELADGASYHGNISTIVAASTADSRCDFTAQPGSLNKFAETNLRGPQIRKSLTQAHSSS